MAILLGLIVSTSFAQKTVEQNRLDSLAKELSLVKKQTSVLSNLKISGYIQAQYQKADTMGAKTFNGGNFSTQDNRFAVRRARLKFAYDANLGSAVFQIDATEKGVNVKNAYISLYAPFDKNLSLTGGIFDRPFGYAIEYSSSSMEVIERPIVFQNLLPGEQEVGAMLSYMPKENALKGLALKAGLFNGNGINPDVDKYKDFIGKISYNGFNFGENVYLNLGTSLYLGHVYNPTATVYTMSEANGVKGFTSSSKEVGAKMVRRYYGFDGQFSFSTEIGKTQVVSEYLFGKQPGSAKSSKSPDYSALPTDASFSRDFAGGYVTLIQQIYKISVFGRYDWYDPNTKVKGNEVGQTASGITATNATDLMLKTTSIGTFYEPNKNIRITGQYDFNRIEDTSNGKFSVAGYKNNLFSLRIQYKF